MGGKWSLIWMVLAAVSGILLFCTGQKVNDGRGKIAVLERDIGQEKDSLKVLGAEWSYLNAPERLEKLAAAHLDLQPMKGRQFVAPADLAALLPAAGGAEPASLPSPVAQEEEDRAPAEDEADAGVLASAPVSLPPRPVRQEFVAQNARSQTRAIRTEKKEKKQAKQQLSRKSSPRSDYVYSQTPRRARVEPGYVYSPSARDRGFHDVVKSLGVR